MLNFYHISPHCRKNFYGVALCRDLVRGNPPADRAIVSILVIPTHFFHSLIMVSDILNFVMADKAWGTLAEKMIVSPSFIG